MLEFNSTFQAVSSKKLLPAVRGPLVLAAFPYYLKGIVYEDVLEPLVIRPNGGTSREVFDTAISHNLK